MPRPRNPIPTYRRHKSSGQAVVTIRTPDGKRKDVLLGPFGSSESQAEYQRIIARLRVTGVIAAVPEPPADISINEVVLAFLKHAAEHYRRPDGSATNEVREYRSAVRVLRGLYGTTPAAEFGPLALQAVRQAMVAAGWCRIRINKQVGRVRRMFRWAAAREMIPGDVFRSLTAVDGLRRGRSAAPDHPPVLPADPEHVERTLAVLYPTVRAMVEFQRLTGAWPGETRMLRMADVDAGGLVWKYTRPDHKMTHADRRRVILIGPRAQAVIRPFLDGLSPADFVFSPARTRQERYAAIRAVRKSKVTPSQVCRKKPAAELKTRPNRRYSDYTYAQAIRRACAKAGVPAWHPNQLRHSYATTARRVYGLEAAQVLLGHAKADVTQVYAERDLSLALKVVAEAG